MNRREISVPKGRNKSKRNKRAIKKWTQAEMGEKTRREKKLEIKTEER
jgi:hypothetical protein